MYFKCRFRRSRTWKMNSTANKLCLIYNVRRGHICCFISNCMLLPGETLKTCVQIVLSTWNNIVVCKFTECYLYVTALPFCLCALCATSYSEIFLHTLSVIRLFRAALIRSKLSAWSAFYMHLRVFINGLS